MNRIHLLSEQVANQIAAGEVVERPVSVVKELVENAIDAQASQIIVEIQAGGRSLIRVTDNGIGMSRDDALLCLERHATSKILKADDLQAITTMGFRGEALPSLASVSRLKLTTRERDTDTVAATQIVIHGGRIVEVSEAGAPSGTCVEARQLFFNLPARRKFLRSEETERAHIQHYLMLAALAQAEIAFTFIQDQRVVWQLPGLKTDGRPGQRTTALQERMRALYGPDLALLAVDFTGELDPVPVVDSEVREHAVKVQVWGFIGAPGVSRSTRENQHVFVNRRPVENRGLNYALLEGYHTALMKGRYPVCCLFIEIDPAEVDVNIHPAKREIKFRRENAVKQLVIQAIRRTLLQLNLAPATPDTKPAPTPASPPANLPTPGQTTPQELPGRWTEVPSAGPKTLVTPLPEISSAAAAPPVKFEPPMPSQENPPVAAPASSSAAPADLSQPPAGPTPAEKPETLPLLAIPLRILGVVGNLYAVLESDRGLVLLDQHAAHERVLFEQMMQRLEQSNAPSQRLLLAETIELSPRDAQFLREQMPVLVRLGVGLNEFGDRTFLLDALPPFVSTGNARRFVMETLDELKATGQTANTWRLGEQIVAKAVCRHAVKAHDPLEPVELEKLLDDLRHCAMPYTCPHGRPTLIEMNFRELEKRFGRVQ